MLGVRGIPAEQPMLAKQPQISRTADRYLWHRRCLFFPGIALAIAQQIVEFSRLDADLRKVHAQIGQISEFQRQQFPIPPGLLRELVVREDIGPLLRVSRMGELDHRHRLQPQLGRRQHPAMPGDDAVLPSTSTGLLNPNSRIEPEICAT